MQPLNRLKIFYLTHLSKPIEDRIIFKAMFEHRPKSILELGIGEGKRTDRLLEIAAHYAEPGDIRYIGIDPFESRSASDGRGMSLIDAHRVLKKSGAKIKLIPGEPIEALIRAINQLGKVDLAIFPTMNDSPSLERLWFFLPRILDDGSILFQQKKSADGRTAYERIAMSEVQRLSAIPRRRAA